MTKLLCNIPEAAHALSVGRSTLYRLLDERAIESVKLGQRRLVVTASIAAYVASLTDAAS